VSKVPNYYEVLGIPENAAIAVIKRRYRELVRVYHPDVAGNKAEAHRIFLRISEAYETLSDADARGAYDRSLQSEREKERRKRDEASAQRRRRYQRIEHGGLGVTPEQKKAANDSVRNAQLAFIQRRLPTAVELCRSALAIDPRNAQAHAILGDIYKIRGKVELAIKHYSFAVQFNPSDRDVERKLTEVLSSSISNTPEEPAYTPGTSGYYKARMNMVGWSMVAGLFVAIRMLPLQVQVLADGRGLYEPQFNLWLLPLMGIIGFLVGFILAVNGWVGSPSRDLLSTGRLVKGGGIRLGHIALGVSVFFFWVTVGIYIFVALLRGDTSRSVSRLLMATVGVLLVTAVVYNSGFQTTILLWCGNLVFPCSVLGWYCGHALDPMKRYGWLK
jgi:curved DNA-binding protein CbpA